VSIFWGTRGTERQFGREECGCLIIWNAQLRELLFSGEGMTSELFCAEVEDFLSPCKLLKSSAVASLRPEEEKGVL